MAKNIYSVSQVNSYIKNMFAQDYLMKNISVRGEVSGLKAHSSGHIYFNLKDEKALIPCFTAFQDEGRDAGCGKWRSGGL